MEAKGNGDGGETAAAAAPAPAAPSPPLSSKARAGAGAGAGATTTKATPLLLVILWASVACEFVTGYARTLTRRWLLSMPGVELALSHRACGRRVCATQDAQRNGVLRRAFTSAPSACLLVGAAVGAWLLRAYGRRAAFMVANTMYIAALALTAAAQNYYMLLVGTIVAELASGIVLVAVILVDAELAPAHQRLAFMTASTTLGFGLGSLCASCLALAQIALPSSAETWFWRVMTAFGTWPCVILLAIVPFVPESPLLLVRQGRTAEALHALKDLRGPFADVKGEFAGIINACAQAGREDARMARGSTWRAALLPQQLRQLLSRRHRPALLVALLVGASQGVTRTEDNIAGFLEVAMRKSFGDKRFAWLLARFLDSFVVPTAGLLAIACNTDRFSRRKMLALGMAVIVAALAGLAVVEAQHYAGAREPPYTKALAASTFALSAISSIAYYSVVRPVAYLIPAELTSAGPRGAAVATNFMFSRLCRLLWGLVADAPAVTARPYLASTLTGALLVTLGALVWLFVPDGTQRVPLEECRHAWQQHWYWGRSAMDPPQNRAARVKRSPSTAPAAAAAGHNPS